MNKPRNSRRSVEDINYPNRLYAIPSASELKKDNLKNEFSNSESEMGELAASQNLYDKIIKFCCSWNFVFIFLALLSSFVIYSILRYWFL